jgi:multiple sugar transport system substrate-binding protein
LGLLAAGCSDSGPEGTPEDPVQLRFAWWGGEERQAITEEAIALFEERHPEISVQPHPVTDYNEYQDQMIRETAGGGGADVLQMDISYLRQYHDNGLLHDLHEQVEAGNLTIGDFREGLIEGGEIDGELLGVPMGSNAMSMYYRPDIFEEAGVDSPDGSWDWSDWNEAAAEITEADVFDGAWGADDYTGEYHFMELWLRQQGENFYTDDGQLNFGEDALVEFWSLPADLREDDLIVPQQVTEENEPINNMSSNDSASLLQWDNFLPGYVADGPDYDYALAPVPTADPDVSGQYLKATMLLSVTTQGEHPEEAARLIDFLVNDEDASQILGLDRGMPPTESRQAAMDPDELDQQIVDYEESIEPLLSDPPPPPPAGTGSVEQSFREIHEQLAYGELSAGDAAAEFFAEAETHLDEAE